MGGHRVPEQGPNDDGFEEEGYDESQRAEILEATRDGPTDGTILTDIAPDLGDDDEAFLEDDLQMVDDEVGEEDPEVDSAPEDIAEDELQEDLDNDDVDADDLDEESGDGDDVALRP